MLPEDNSEIVEYIHGGNASVGQEFVVLESVQSTESNFQCHS